MAGNNALLVVVAVFILIIAGCSQQQAAPAPTPAPQPTTQCPGTGANYCNGNELMMNAKCVLGMWQYSSEVCANGCEAGKCKEAAPAPTPTPAPTPAPEPVPTEVNQTAPPAPVPGPTPAPVPPVVAPAPAPEAVAPSAADLKKLLVCGVAFSDKYYRFTASTPASTVMYGLKITNEIRPSYIQTSVEYRDLPFPEYSKILSTDYRTVDTCSCTARQLLISYKTYGSRSSGEEASGGKCGVAPVTNIAAYALLYDNVDPSKIMQVGEGTVNLAGYVGPVKEFYQEGKASDGSFVKESYYVADLLPLPVMINGTAQYADGTAKSFKLELLP